MSYPVLASDNQFSVSIEYFEGYLSLNQAQVKPALEENKFQQEGELFAEIISTEGDILYQTHFDLENIAGWDVLNISHPYLKPSFDFDLNLPYYPNAKTLNIYDQNNTLLLSVDLSPYAEREYFLEAKNATTTEGITATEETEAQSATTVFPKEIIIAVIIFAIIVIILLFFAFRIRRPNPS
ncbi:MAG: hypothetical protein ABIA37_03185 [Candidatus Woesearchaeota archaeon]